MNAQTPAFPNIHEIWVYLSGSPLLALILTLGAYQLGVIVYERANRHPLANPVLIAIVLVAATITLIDMPYPKYFEGAQFVHFLLGTATVSLAAPIRRSRAASSQSRLPRRSRWASPSGSASRRPSPRSSPYPPASSAPFSPAMCSILCAAESGGSGASRSASPRTAWAPQGRSASTRKRGPIRASRWDCTGCWA